MLLSVYIYRSNRFRFYDLLIVHGDIFHFRYMKYRNAGWDYMKKVVHGKKNIRRIFSMRGSPSSLVGPLHFKNTIFEVHPRTFTRFPFTYHPPSSPPFFFSLISFAVKLFRPSFRNFFGQAFETFS